MGKIIDFKPNVGSTPQASKSEEQSSKIAEHKINDGFSQQSEQPGKAIFEGRTSSIDLKNKPTESEDGLVVNLANASEEPTKDIKEAADTIYGKRARELSVVMSKTAFGMIPYKTGEELASDFARIAEIDAMLAENENEVV